MHLNKKKFQSHWFLFEISACSIDISHAISICDLLYFFGSWGFCSLSCLCIQKLALSWAWISAIILRVNQWFLTGGVLIYFPPWLYQCHIHSTDSRIHAVSRSRKLRILISKEEISIVIKYFYHMTMFPLKRNDHNNPHKIEVSTCSQYGWCQRFPYPLRFHMIANKGFNLKVLY